MSSPNDGKSIAKFFEGLGASARAAIRWIFPTALVLAAAALLSGRLQMAEERDLSRRLLVAASAVQSRIQSELDRCVRQGWECSLETTSVDPDTPAGFGEKRAAIIVKGEGGRKDKKIGLNISALVPALRDPNSPVVSAFLAFHDGRILEDLRSSSERRFVELELEWSFQPKTGNSPEAGSRAGESPGQDTLANLLESFRAAPTSVRADPVMVPIAIGRHEYLLATTRLTAEERSIDGPEGAAPTSAQVVTRTKTYYLAALSRRSAFPLSSPLRSAIREALPFVVITISALTLISLLWSGRRDGSVPRQAIVLLSLVLSMIAVVSVAWVSTAVVTRQGTNRVLTETVSKSVHLGGTIEAELEIARDILKRADSDEPRGTSPRGTGCGHLSSPELGRGMSYFEVDRTGMQICLDSASGSKPVSVADREYFVNSTQRRDCEPGFVSGPYFIIGWQDATPRLVFVLPNCRDAEPGKTLRRPTAAAAVVTFTPSAFRRKPDNEAIAQGVRTDSGGVATDLGEQILLLEGERVRFSSPPSYQAVGWSFASQVATDTSVLSAISSRIPWAQLTMFDDHRAAVATRTVGQSFTLIVARFLDEQRASRVAIARSFLRTGFWIWLPPLVLVGLLAGSGRRHDLIDAMFPQRRPALRYWIGSACLLVFHLTVLKMLPAGATPELTVLSAFLVGLGSSLIFFFALVDSQNARKWDLRLAAMTAICFLVVDVMFYIETDRPKPGQSGAIGVAAAQIVLIALLLAKAHFFPLRTRATARRRHRFGYCLVAGFGIVGSFVLPTQLTIHAATLAIQRAASGTAAVDKGANPVQFDFSSAPFPSCIVGSLQSRLRSGAECLLPESELPLVEALRLRLSGLGEEDFEQASASSSANTLRSRVLPGYLLATALIALTWAVACALWFGWRLESSRSRSATAHFKLDKEDWRVLELIQASRLPAWRFSGTVHRLVAAGLVSARDGLRLRTRRATRMAASGAERSDPIDRPSGSHRLLPVLVLAMAIGLPALIWILDNPQILKSAVAWLSALLAANGLRSGRGT